MDIKNNAIQKLSPMEIRLKSEQEDLVCRVLKFAKFNLKRHHKAIFTITGDAGTGKSVVLSHLFYRIQILAAQSGNAFSDTRNFFLVNHPEVLKVYRSMAGRLPHMYKKYYQRPTSFINQHQKQQTTADVVVIDEAHLLLSKSDHYNKFFGANQLQSIMELARIVVLVFDPSQVIKTKSYWDSDSLKCIVNQYIHEDYHLQHQFRMNASQDLIHWIDAFTKQKLISSLPLDFGGHYDFRIFGDAQEMYEAIKHKDQRYGLSRITATINYPSVLDGGKHYVTEGRFHLPWDQYNFTAVPWAEIPDTINEVGSIYTVQGFDLNYIGIILGPSVELDRHHPDKIKIDLTKVTDREIFKRRDDIKSKIEFEQVKLDLFLNSINVLMKRGRYGMYLYAHDAGLRQTLLNLQKNSL